MNAKNAFGLLRTVIDGQHMHLIETAGKYPQKRSRLVYDNNNLDQPNRLPAVADIQTNQRINLQTRLFARSITTPFPTFA